ncbi:conserved peptide upstream open reading frame 3, partial [Prunus dulcis]
SHHTDPRMLENPTSAAAAAADPPANVKRYAPPVRGIVLLTDANRFDRTNNPQGGSDLEKNQISSSRSLSGMDHGDASSSSLLNENSRPGLLALEGCSSSAAFQLLNNRWAAAMHCINDPSVDLSERPVMYTGGGSAWGQFQLPHQLMASTGGAGSPGSSMDFLSELRRSKNISHASFRT